MELPSWYGQRDSRWASEKLGFSASDTIGNYGCLITCISIMIRAFDWPGNQASPHDVNVWLKGHGGYVEEDLVVWAKVPQMTAITDRGAYYGRKTQDIANFLNEGNTLAICGVEIFGSGHFVLAYKAAGGDVWVHDPWFNEQRRLSSYGATWTVAHLYGDATPNIPVVNNPVVAPPTPDPAIAAAEAAKEAQRIADEQAKLAEAARLAKETADKALQEAEQARLDNEKADAEKAKEDALNQARQGFWYQILEAIVNFINKLTGRG